MNKKINILFLLLFLNALGFAQNNAIFKGGTADGWVSRNYVQLNTNIFKGGNGDGWASLNYLQSSTNIFKGGNGDGWASLNYLQGSTNIFKGGNGDGWASLNYLQSSTNIFKGGNGDGWSSIATPSLPVSLIYYSKATGNLHDVTAWGTNPDGSGTNPADFSTGIFNLANRSIYTLTADWTVGGTTNIPTSRELQINGFTYSEAGITGTGTLTGSLTSNLIVTGTSGGDAGTINFTVGNNNLNNFTINRSGTSASATLGTALNVFNTLAVNNGTINTGNLLTLKSTATGTARLAPVTSATITGNLIVERYISNRRSWRLLGVPFSTATQTIKASWMEGGSNASGFGTQITTFTGDPNAANFDAVKPASSIRTYSSDNFNSDAAHTPNTASLITSNTAYFLFVRGDRAVDRTTPLSPTTATTLRIAGAASVGNITKGITSTNFSLITNPYPSAIDFDVVKAANPGISKFYVWDATMGGTDGVGQYRTIDINGSAPNYTYIATPGGVSNNWRFIESGTAFFVPGSTTIAFTEAAKSSGIPPSSMLRTFSGNETELVVNLNTFNTDNTVSLVDGIREVFNTAYSASVDKDDAKKITAFNANFGIESNNEVLSIEKRPLPKQDETISLKLWGITPGNYQFEVQPDNFPSGLTPYLNDNYLNTKTPVDVNAITKINFGITSDAASAAANRFSIVFTKPVSFNINPAIIIYPNPVYNDNIKLQFNNMPKGNYMLKLINTLGQIVIIKQIEHAGGSSLQTLNVNKIKGSYMLEIIEPDKTKFTNKVIVN